MMEPWGQSDPLPISNPRNRPSPTQSDSQVNGEPCHFSLERL